MRIDLGEEVREEGGRRTDTFFRAIVLLSLMLLSLMLLSLMLLSLILLSLILLSLMSLPLLSLSLPSQQSAPFPLKYSSSLFTLHLKTVLNRPFPTASPTTIPSSPLPLNTPPFSPFKSTSPPPPSPSAPSTISVLLSPTYSTNPSLSP